MSKRTKILTEIIASLFILLFLYTALSKLSDVNRMELTIATSPVIGDRAKMVAWTVPIVEIIISVWLFIPRLRYHGLMASFILMLVFTFYVAGILAFADLIPCSCGGVISEMSWGQHLIFNIIFSLIALLGVRLYRSNKDFIAINRNSRIPV